LRHHFLDQYQRFDAEKFRRYLLDELSAAVCAIGDGLPKRIKVVTHNSILGHFLASLAPTKKMREARFAMKGADGRQDWP
jgi:hypothetical protein